MKYNVDFNIASGAVLLFLYLFLLFQYTVKVKNNVVFRRFVLALLIADILEIISIIGISYSIHLPNSINYLIQMSYLWGLSFCMILFVEYIKTLFGADGRNVVWDWINLTSFGFWCIILITTPYTRLLFYFDSNHTYTPGAFWMLSYLAPLFLLISGLVRAILNYKRITRKQLFSIIGFISFCIIGVIVQFIVTTSTLVSMFFVTQGIFVMLFSLETLDYGKLISKMNELKDISEAAERTKLEAINANKEKSAFVAGISNEIRTPLNGIMGMNRIAMDINKDPEVDECLRSIKDAGRSLLAIVGDVMDISKIEYGSMQLDNTEYNMADFISGMVSIVKIKAKEQKLDFVVETDPKLPSKLYGDVVRIRQIVNNLLNNALKYTAKGRIRLYVGFRPVKDDIVELKFKVTDTGIGIKEEEIAGIFNSYKIKDDELGTNEGTGLSLKISKALAEQMNGTIWVDSEFGKGSTFTVFIQNKAIDSTPMGQLSTETDEESTIVAPNVSGKGNTLEGKTILVVDDVDLNIRVIRGLLKKTGLIVEAAISGRQCLNMVMEKKYDLIFLDHMMPEMDGIETLKTLKSRSKCINLNTPVIALTANANSGAKEQYIGAGFDGYITKPVSNEDLSEAINNYIFRTIDE